MTAISRRQHVASSVVAVLLVTLVVVWTLLMMPAGNACAEHAKLRGYDVCEPAQPWVPWVSECRCWVVDLEVPDEAR